MTGARILIVEDEAVLAIHLSRILSDWGHCVTSVVATGGEAIASAAEDPPDLALMDISLRGELDGVETARVIRERFGVPVIYLTAFADERTLERAKATDPYGYALKPFHEKELRITIEVALYRHHADQALSQRGAWLDAMLTSVGDAIIATDADGRVMFMNDHAEDLTGWARSDAFSKDIAEILPAPSADELVPEEHFVKRVLRKHGVVSRGPGAALLTRDGDKIPLEDCAAPIRDRNGKVLGAVIVFRDATERREAEARLVHMAHHDALTGLPNRVLFQERLRHAMARARRNRSLVAVLLLDLDDFKIVNDTLGHAAGDTLLIAAADRVKGCVRATDTVARLGGDEIAIIQPDLDNPVGATTLADKLVEAFNRPFPIGGTEVTTTASVGITVFPLDEQDPEEVIRSADNSMYRAKAAGRNRYDVASNFRSASADRWRCRGHELQRAIERSEFEIYFQPIFDLRNQRVTGAEALIRWNHPEEGLIPASGFIRAAERIGLMTEIVDMSLRKACSAAAGWLSSDPDLRVSVNLSNTDLERRDLVSVVSVILQKTSLAADHLELEVAEKPTVERLQARSGVNIQGLRDLGVLITLDHFGVEYASMLTMRALPVRTVKIDRSLIRAIPEDRQAAEIIKATVDVSERFNISVVAVGVETRAQLDWLKTAGCPQAQGNLLGAPKPTEEFLELHVM